MRTLILLACLLGVALGARAEAFSSVMTARKYGQVHNPFRADVVDELDLDKYQGRWFQIRESPVSRFFTGMTDCNTQDYKLLENGSLSTTFSGNKEAGSELMQKSGYLYRPDDSKAGALKLRLFGMAVPIEVPYDVIALGPKGKGGRYQWAIVTDTLNTALYVLVRELNMAKDDNFIRQINNKLEDFGFNKPWNKPSSVKQGGNCKYAPTPKDGDEFGNFFEF